MNNNNTKINNVKKYILNQLIETQIDLVLSEQQVMPPGAPPAPVDPSTGLPPDPSAPMPPDPAAAPPMDASGEEGEEESVEDADSGSEQTMPEDPVQDIVDKVKEKMDSDADKTSGNEGTLTSLAKSYLQDFDLLDKSKQQQAQDLVAKLKAENIPELKKVALELEKFLSN